MQLKKLFAMGACATVAAGVTYGQEAMDMKEFDDAFANGTFMGMIEFMPVWVDRDNVQNDPYHFGTTAFTLNYKTAMWQGFSAGIETVAHTTVWDSDDDMRKNELDMGLGTYKSAVLSELYLSYTYDMATATVGRWDSKSLSHANDWNLMGSTHLNGNKAEGANLMLCPYEEVEVLVGAVSKINEADWDNILEWVDVEDFGNADADEWIYFGELKLDVVDGLMVNPYVYLHDDDANIYGVDVLGAYEMEDMTIGARAHIYNVDDDTDLPGVEDATVWGIVPNLTIDQFDFELGYVQFDDDNANNQPFWFADYLVWVTDQDRPYGQNDCDVWLGKAQYNAEEWWVSLAVAVYNWEGFGANDDPSEVEYELWAGYDVTTNLEVMGGVMIVRTNDDAENIGWVDYERVEGRVRYKF